MSQIFQSFVGLADPEGAVSFLDQGIEYLRTSLKKIDEIAEAYNILLNKAVELGYTGNPLAPQLSELGLKESLEGKILQPKVVSPIWEEIEGRFQRDNLLETFRYEQREFAKLEKPTNDLIAVFEACKPAAKQGTLIEEIEDNKIPMRQYFGRLFSQGYYLATLFLYSSLICTELCYRSEGLDSLGEFETIEELRERTAQASHRIK